MNVHMHENDCKYSHTYKDEVSTNSRAGKFSFELYFVKYFMQQNK